MAKYRITPSSKAIIQLPISIGHKAEKGVEAIEFDLTAWVETYGSGTLTVIMRRWGDAIPYPIALEIDENNKATWTLSDTDTAKAGMAYAQLSYIVGDTVVKKSDIYTFRVMDSLTGEGEPPEAYESWLEHLTHLAAEAMAEVLDIEGIVTDKTLTVDGGIADAKAAGDALALKADKSTTYTKTEVDHMIEDVEVETDTTLSVSGAPADAKATGDALSALEDAVGDEISEIKADLNYALSIGQKGSAVLPNTYIAQGSYLSSGVLYADTKRISTIKINVYKDEVIEIAHGSNCAISNVLFWDTEWVYEAKGWAIGNKHITVPYDGYFACTFAHSNLTDAISPADYDATIALYSLTGEKLSNITSRVETLEGEIGIVTPDDTSFFEQLSHNMINPADIETGFYLSPSTLKIAVSSTSNIYAMTGLIPVKEGESYCASGTAFLGLGGYFGQTAKVENNQSAIDAVTFYNPVTGSGKFFTVPKNQNIKYVSLTLKKDLTTQQIDGTYQLEIGEMASDIVPYTPYWKIMEQYIPETADTSDITQLPDISYDSAEKAKISNFIAHWLAKDKDLMVVGTGTSLTARSSEHCTLRDDATSRPPLMHSNNFASHIWDRIMWDGQQYRRFDYPDFFTETGTFTDASNLEDWDDYIYRYGLTRYASGPASVAFEIPEDAWQFNFIYRSDSEGTETATVTVTEGNGKVEVFNGSSWVEANGYTFSMLETPVILSSVAANNPTTANNASTTLSNYQVGGNTTYQKRLKMRCKSSLIDSRDTTKTVTISATSGRLLYWGVEWSARQYMITYVNSARGSHSNAYNTATSLQHYQDNEIWSFKPDLILAEDPIHNAGAGGADLAPYYTTYWEYVTDNFFFNTDDGTSMVSRATANGLDPANIEWIIFTSSLSWNFGGINDNGILKLYEDKSGKVLNALEAQTLTHVWLITNETDVVSINACQYWCDAGKQLFGDMKSATVGSGKNGNTFTNEGSHWNDMGSAVMAKCIAPIFDFYY